MASITLYKTYYARDATHLARCSLKRWFQWWKPQVSIFVEKTSYSQNTLPAKTRFFLHFPAEITFLKSLLWIEAALQNLHFSFKWKSIAGSIPFTRKISCRFTLSRWKASGEPEGFQGIFTYTHVPKAMKIISDT